MKETEDPEPYLTAASAALNVFFLENGLLLEEGKKMPAARLRKFQQDIQFCLGKFKELQAKAEKSGVWQNVSTDRQLEIGSRARFALRTFEQFDAMIARAEAPDQNTASEEVADILSEIP